MKENYQYNQPSSSEDSYGSEEDDDFLQDSEEEVKDDFEKVGKQRRPLNFFMA